jgi:hypothetical protein
MNSVAAPWLEIAISRYRASFNKEKVLEERAKHDDLTSRENGAKEEPREVCGLERRTTRDMAQAWPPRDDVGPLLWCNMERRDVAPGLYSPVML